MTQTLLATDTRGIGDRLATAVALSAFHRRVPRIVYLTLARDFGNIWTLLKPFCSEVHPCDDEQMALDPDGNRISLPYYWRWNADDLIYSRDAGFYITRIDSIATLTQIKPGPIQRDVFKIIPHIRTLYRRKYVVLHPYASTAEKSMPVEDIQAIKDYCMKCNIPLYVLPLPRTTLSEAIKYVNDAALVIAVDSCISHFAYWLRQTLPTIVCYYGTSKDFAFRKLPEPLPTCFSGTELAKIKTIIDRL